MAAVQLDADAQRDQLVDDVYSGAQRQTFMDDVCEPDVTPLVKLLSERAIQFEVDGGDSLSDTDLENMKQNVSKHYGCDC